MNIVELIKNGESKTLEFKENGSFVLLVFYRKIVNKELQKSDEKVTKKWLNNDEILIPTLQEEEVIDFIKENGKIMTADVEKLLNVKTTRAKYILYQMVKKGFIKKVGKTKGSFYILEENKRIVSDE